jgi:hypothetical protein
MLSQESRTILLIDDNQDLFDVLAVLLGARGFKDQGLGVAPQASKTRWQGRPDPGDLTPGLIRGS